MTRRHGSIERRDGIFLQPGEWLEVIFPDNGRKGVGKFDGVWDNPTLGWIYGLSFFRYYDKPEDRTDIFGSVGVGKPIDPKHPLETAVRVAGPMSSSGRPPRRKTEPPHLTVIEGGVTDEK